MVDGKTGFPISLLQQSDCCFITTFQISYYSAKLSAKNKKTLKTTHQGADLQGLFIREICHLS
jgi:hypothetical protein